MQSMLFKIVSNIVIITVIVVGGGFYFLQKHQNESAQVILAGNQKSRSITIMVPENYDAYIKKMTQFVQGGGKDPLKTFKFIKKEIIISQTSDIIKATAQAAAEEIGMGGGGGPSKILVSYLRVQNGTAYVLLNIDLDGWAGVSVSIAIIHPLVEKSLLQFPEIKHVIFDYVP